jgi:uncharacterized protein
MPMLDSHAQLDRETPSQHSTRGGPAWPTAGALGVLRPLDLDAARLDPGGLLGQWQERNAAATLPHCVDQLEHSGALGNLRALRSASAGHTFAGMWFADSDVYKTLEAAAWQLARGDDAGLAAFVEAGGALLAQVQEADGYLNSYYVGERTGRRWRELHRSHEMYCAGHLIQAAVAADRAGIGEPLMSVARRLADLLVQRFGAGGADGVDGHPEIETALVELYRATGHRPYLDLAARFVDLRGHGLLADGGFGPVYY